MSQFNNIPSDKELESVVNHLFKGLSGFNQLAHVSHSDSGVFQRKVTTDYDQISAHDKEFNIANPQTSLKDPLLRDEGKFPLAQAGDGSSPHFKQEGRDAFNSYANPSHSAGLEDISQKFADSYAYQSNLGANSASLDDLIPKDIFAFNNPISYQPEYGDEIPFAKETYSTFNAAISPLGSPYSFVGNDLLQDHSSNFDVYAIRKDFPILSEYVNGRPLVWFDNAATTQKPQVVIDRLAYFYQHENSNIHRAAHELAACATDAYEKARETIQSFINAKSVNEIIFTRGTTESINLIANSWGAENLKEGDEIIISNLEHHANIVPWQLLSQKNGFKIKVIPVNDAGELLIDEYKKLFTDKTKLVSFTHVSNALGTVTPAKQIIEIAHSAGAKVLLDGAQSISHIKVDVQDLNPDFFVFSGHKIFGPTGIGAVYGKEELLNQTQPYQGGGNMIQDVTFEKTIFHPAPNRFEAGTGNIADAVGLAAALDYVQKIRIDRIAKYEHELLDYATSLFKQITKVKLIGTAKDKASVMSFTIDGFSNEEVGKVLNDHGIAVRTGHHCAQPILRRLGYENSVPPSFAFYNTFAEIDLLADVVRKLASSKF